MLVTSSIVLRTSQIFYSFPATFNFNTAGITYRGDLNGDSQRFPCLSTATGPLGLRMRALYLEIPPTLTIIKPKVKLGPPAPNPRPTQEDSKCALGEGM